jgi:hypothetical protein
VSLSQANSSFQKELMNVWWSSATELKPLSFAEKKWLALSDHTDFTLAVVQCTDLNSCINTQP